MRFVIHGLCPSSDVPTANWDFRYAIYSAPDCQGTQLNDGAHNLTCFDANDIATQAFPNQSNEFLNPGLNTNHILCTTTNASKQWNFGSCATATTDADIAADNTRYDCGCTPNPAAATCDCGPGGVTSADLEQGCAFETTTCNILCTTVAPVCDPLDPLAPAEGFNVFVGGNAELTSIQAAGAVAIGGNLLMKFFYTATSEPGTAVTINGISNIGLVVNGLIDWAGSTGHVGLANSTNAYIGDFNGGFLLLPGVLFPPNGRGESRYVSTGGHIFESVPFDVASQLPKLLLYSAKMGALSPATCPDAATATIENDAGGPWTPGDGNGHLVLVPNRANILNLTVNDVIALTDLVGDVPSPTEPLIINITDSGAMSLPGKDFQALMTGVTSVIWNFPHATSLTLEIGNLWGTTYAPAADVTAGPGVNFEDDVVSGSFVSPVLASVLRRPGAFAIPCLCDP